MFLDCGGLRSFEAVQAYDIRLLYAFSCNAPVVEHLLNVGLSSFTVLFSLFLAFLWRFESAGL